MSKNNYAFPWGIYIGELIDNSDSIPLCLDSKEGGFCVLFDESSEQITNNFIENIALKLFEVLPIGDIVVDIFDFSHKKRFMHLSSLQNEKLYDIAFNQNSATNKFNVIEETALNRHHNILTSTAPTISDYNQQSKFREQYHLLLINLDSFPDEMTSAKRIKNFFDSAYEAGFYMIAFGSRNILESELKATQVILNQFPHIYIANKEITLTKKLFEFADMLEDYVFEYVNDNKDSIIKNLISQLQKENEGSSEQNFLSIPIGRTVNGRDEVNFSLGKKSMNYHAFITGTTGTGKTNMINSIILGIAQNYTSKEVELYLMDYKLGTEFGIFERHPNCRKIFLDNQDLEASVGILEAFVKIMNEREQKFKLHRVSDIDEYNKKNPQEPMARKLLIIDEVQQLFDGSFGEQQHFNKLLEKVVRLGRSFGLHIILSTQSLVGVNINKSIMLQIGLRISYRLSEYSEASKIFNDRNIEEVQKLKKDKFEFIYNSDLGAKEANVVGRANFLDKDRIEITINEIIGGLNEELVLVPEIVRSGEEGKVQEVSQNRKRESVGEYIPVVNNASEEKWMLKLKKMGTKPKSEYIK